jgi:hypothetical protein
MEFLRKYATPLSLVTGVAVSVTGLMLLFGIRGEMGDLHEWIGVAFVVAIVLHIVRNWRALGFLFKSPTSATIAVVGGLALAVLIVLHMPMFGEGAHGGHRGGPWMVLNRVADAPIAVSAPALGLTPDEAVTRLRAAGIDVDGPKDSLAHLVRDHGQPLPRLYGVLLRQN